jgi:WD40 repeat protein
MFSADLLGENNINYIIVCNYNNTEPVKVYDTNGKFIKLINESNESSLVLYNFYDKDLSKNYIITGNRNNVIAYDFTSNTIFHKYFDVQNDKFHSDIIIFKEDNITKLIESCNDGFIRIWNFHSCLLLNKINLENYDKCQYCLCLWDDSYLFVGCINKIILINYKKNQILGYYKQIDNPLTLNKVYLSKYGNCLISQEMGKQPIKFWIK